ncbi:unnamed protein product [Rangifer tarandus platyrhynchus]|uniref:Uncharacterized protein n=2 Tax=Rangifer tarandus platyrhynchus TaxID=3082113 RepID=A0AC59YCH1_RANTA|nr:unnamed protein product [Rangifer tarandus platyrhynchus]
MPSKTSAQEKARPGGGGNSWRPSSSRGCLQDNSSGQSGRKGALGSDPVGLQGPRAREQLRLYRAVLSRCPAGPPSCPRRSASPGRPPESREEGRPGRALRPRSARPPAQREGPPEAASVPAAPCCLGRAVGEAGGGGMKGRPASGRWDTF